MQKIILTILVTIILILLAAGIAKFVQNDTVADSENEIENECKLISSDFIDFTRIQNFQCPENNYRCFSRGSGGVSCLIIEK